MLKKINILILINFIIIHYTFSQSLPKPVIKHNFPIELTSGWRTNYGSVQFYDLDGDGNLEIIIGIRDSMFVIRSNGEHFPGWPQEMDCYASFGEAAVGDIDGDGYKEILFSGFGPRGSGALYAWHHDGSQVRNFPKVYTNLRSWILGPTLYDINNDGKLEIFIKVENFLYAYNCYGNIINGWPKQTYFIFSSTAPRIADIDTDGNPEIFIASYEISVKDTSFAVDCFEADGSIKIGWPFLKQGEMFHSTQLGAIGRLGKNGEKYLAIGSSGHYIDYNFYVLNSLGEIVNGWPQKIVAGLWIDNGVNLFNFKNNYYPDVIITGDMFGCIFAWERDGISLPKFPYEIPTMGIFPGDICGVPILYHDIENNEFIVFTSSNTSINDTGFVCATRSDSTQMPWSPLRPLGTTQNTPAFRDLDNDGSVEMVVLTREFPTLKVYLYVWEFKDIPFDKQRFPWPVGSGNRWNTGEFGFEPTDTILVSVKSEKWLPQSPKLFQNYPNSFNSTTKIRYEIDKRARVRINIYNTLGQKLTTLVDAEQQAGTYEAVWNAEKFSSGVYYVKLETPNYTEVKKLVFMK